MIKRIISSDILLSIFFAANAQETYNHNIVAGADGIPHWQGFKSNAPTGKWGFQQNELMFMGIGGNVYNKGFSTNAMGIINGTATKEDIFLYNVNSPNADFLVLKASGNVGIGTTSPSGLLHIAQNDGASDAVRAPILLSRYWSSGTDTRAAALFNYHNSTNNNDQLVFAVAGSGGSTNSPLSYSQAKMVIQGNGNVGIGTTNPRGLFDVGGNGDIYLSNSPNTGIYQSLFLPGHIYIAPHNGGNVSYLQARRQDNSGSTQLQIRTYDNGNLVEAMLINSNGNVLIGKTSQTNSSYKLDINGNARVNKVVVNTTGADFVFEKDYNLRTLEELQKYIRKNKHLPEIPSAKEMRKEGLDVGEMNIKLLQKIEEMTLYIIEMKKEYDERIKKLESDNAIFKKSH